MRNKNISIYSIFLDSHQQLQIINVFVSFNRGLADLQIIGGADKTVREAKVRVKQAICNSNFHYPNCKIVVNLQPADLAKQGTSFDLPIALGILALSEQITLPDRLLSYGELSLDGKILAPLNLLAMDASELKRNLQTLALLKNSGICQVLAAANATLNSYLQAALGQKILAVNKLADLKNITTLAQQAGNKADLLAAKVSDLRTKKSLTAVDPTQVQTESKVEPLTTTDTALFATKQAYFYKLQTQRLSKERVQIDLAKAAASAAQKWQSLKNMELAKNTFVLALAGGHSLLILGANGTGKTELAATSLYFLLPELQVINARSNPYFTFFPFQEISCTVPPSILRKALGCRRHLSAEFSSEELPLGCLTFNELNQFQSKSLLQLQVFLEYVQKRQLNADTAFSTASSDTQEQKTYLATAFLQLICSMNPCPCGNFFEGKSVCTCTLVACRRFNRRLGMAVLDRLQVYIYTSFKEKPANNEREQLETVAAKKYEAASTKLSANCVPDLSDLANLRKRILDCRRYQRERNLQVSGRYCLNADLTFLEIANLQKLTAEDSKLLDLLREKQHFSYRRELFIRLLAQTMADFYQRTLTGRDLMAAANYCKLPGELCL